LKEKSRLFLVPTPLGNLEDITLRALRILKEVDIILAEDTRNTGRLLNHYSIHKPLKSFHAFNEHRMIPRITGWLQQGNRIALVSDAGTPAVSDPGYLIVQACIVNAIPFECLPGPTALIPALVQSGLPSDSFVFLGFIPVKKGRKKILEMIRLESRTMICYESPHRLARTLGDLADFLGGDRRISVSREISKMYEETTRGTIEEVLHQFKNSNPKGEFVLVLSGCTT
jgi:16S rRNA (cytidine1402-2'-O)-methyltransferase